MPNQFAPLSAKEKHAEKNVLPVVDVGSAILPIPEGVKRAIPYHPTLGKYSSFWVYRDKQGLPLFCVVRFITSEGKKEDRPLTYRKYKDASCGFAWKSVDAPRPLYGLDHLAANPEAHVIVCEGEKAADAATEKFPEYVAVTSPNGAGSPHKADWSPLKGRDVVLWPDNDDEGRQYVAKVVELIRGVPVSSAKIVAIPEAFRPKWDLADDLPSNYTKEDLHDLLNQAKEVHNPLENLLERIEEDGIEEAYGDDVADAAISLQKSDRSAYMGLRSRLKKAGIGITQFDKHLLERSIKTGEVRPEPDHLDIARSVVQDIGAENILSSESSTWIWRNEGVWRPVIDRQLKKYIQQYLSGNSMVVTRSKVDAVLDVLKTEVHADEHEWNMNDNIINVKNGELSWDGNDWELKPHKRAHYRTTQIPTDYDLAADCPRFKQFLEEVFEGDKDADEKARLILEMVGYSLVSHAKYEKFILLIGAGANGKSVILDMLGALLGKDNVSAVLPTQFDSKFQRAHLHSKLANIVSEMREGGQIADAELKAITSGELTTVEHKNKDPFDFKPFATCWFGTNHMPHTRDFSDALFRRAFVVQFNNKFVEGKSADTNLKHKLKKELSGILRLAISAYASVITTGKFTEPKSCLAAKAEWRKEADQAAMFAAERCVLNEISSVESSVIYAEYVNWANEAGIIKKLNRKSFTQRLTRLGCHTKRGAGGKRMISGIRIGWEEI